MDFMNFIDLYSHAIWRIEKKKKKKWKKKNANFPKLKLSQSSSNPTPNYSPSKARIKADEQVLFFAVSSKLTWGPAELPRLFLFAL